MSYREASYKPQRATSGAMNYQNSHSKTRRPIIVKVKEQRGVSGNEAWEDKNTNVRYKHQEDGKYVATSVHKNGRLRPFLPVEKINVLNQGLTVVENKAELTVTNEDLKELFIQVRDLLVEINEKLERTPR